MSEDTESAPVLAIDGQIVLVERVPAVAELADLIGSVTR